MTTERMPSCLEPRTSDRDTVQLRLKQAEQAGAPRGLWAKSALVWCRQERVTNRLQGQLTVKCVDNRTTAAPLFHPPKVSQGNSKTGLTATNISTEYPHLTRNLICLSTPRPNHRRCPALPNGTRQSLMLSMPRGQCKPPHI